MALKSIKPTLIIGLGIEGRKILTDFKNELFRSFGDLPAIKLLALDFKEEVMKEEKQRAIIENYFSYYIGKDLLDSWLKKASTGLRVKPESFVKEYNLGDSNLKELVNSVLKKPDGTYIDVTINEKPYEKYEVEKFKSSIQKNAEKIETAGISKIEKLIDSNYSSIKKRSSFCLF